MLQDLEGSLVGRMWPQSRVLVGMNVSQWIRHLLISFCESVEFESIRRIQSQVIPKIDVTHDLRRFLHPSVRFHVLINSRELCAPVLSSLNVAWRSPLGSKIARLEIVNAMEWSTRTGETLEKIPRMCTSLTTLRLQGFQAQPDSFGRFCSNLHYCPALVDLDLRLCGLSVGQSIVLSRSLTSLGALQSLDLAFNSIEDFAESGLFLGQCPSLRNVDISGNTSFSRARLDALLHASSNLKQLTLCSLQIRSSEAASLGQALAHHPHLEHLDVAFNKLGHDGVLNLLQPLRACSRLTYLDVTSNGMSGLGTVACLREVLLLFPAIRSVLVGEGHPRYKLGRAQQWPAKHHSEMRTISAAAPSSELGSGPGAQTGSVAMVHVRGKIGDAGIREVALVLGRASLRHLDLGGNQVGDSGAQWLGDALGSCLHLSCVMLDHNRIDVAGVKGLAHGLVQCTALRGLSLSHNFVRGGECVRELGPVLQCCRDLRWLGLENGRLGREGAEVLAESLGALGPSARLEGLNLRHNQLGDGGVASLVPALGGCTALEDLELAENGIGAAGAGRLGEAMRELRRLRYVGLRCNGIGDEGAAALGWAVGQCAGLELLDVGVNRIGEEARAAMAAAVAHTRCAVDA